jgi:glutamate/aspartate transport system substrate-binding protein
MIHSADSTAAAALGQPTDRRHVVFRVALVVCAFVASADIALGQPLEGRLKQINDTKVVKLAYRSDSNPFSFLDQRSQPVGYTIDLCKLVVTSLERQLNSTLNVQWVAVTSQNRFDAIANDRADMECGSSTVTLGRMKEVDFSSIIFVENTGVMVKAASRILRINDLKGKTIAVISGTTNERALARELQRRQLDATLLRVASRTEGMAALEAGSADGFAGDKLLLSALQAGAPVVMLPEDLSVEPYAIVLPRGDWAFRLAVNTALAEIYRSDKILDIYAAWFSGLGLRPNVLIGAVYMLGALPD